MAVAATRPVTFDGSPTAPVEVAKVALVSISKPIWFYSLESLAAQILPSKEGKLRRIAFGQLALPDHPEPADAMKKARGSNSADCPAGIPPWLSRDVLFFPALCPDRRGGGDGRPSGREILRPFWHRMDD